MQVTINLPENLITNLHPHEGELARILELGLREFKASSSIGYKSVAEVLKFFLRVCRRLKKRWRCVLRRNCKQRLAS